MNQKKDKGKGKLKKEPKMSKKTNWGPPKEETYKVDSILNAAKCHGALQ